jgi:addiction module HigA family antidote
MQKPIIRFSNIDDFFARAKAVAKELDQSESIDPTGARIYKDLIDFRNALKKINTRNPPFNSMCKRLPTHPGAILREDVLPALGISVNKLAKHLRISKQTLHAVLSERYHITPGLALRLGTYLGNEPQIWITMQSKYDLCNKK